MKRRRISGSDRLAILHEHGSACNLCRGQIVPEREKWHLDHEIPLALGGDDEPANLRPVHFKCHLDKTRQDVARIAKAKRRELKNAGIRKPPAFRHPRYRRRMDGKAVDRITGEPA